MWITNEMAVAFKRWSKKEGFSGFDATYHVHLWRAFQAGMKFMKRSKAKRKPRRR